MSRDGDRSGPSSRAMASIGTWLLVLLDALSFGAGAWALLLSVPGGPTLQIEGIISSEEALNPAIVCFAVQGLLLWLLPSRRTFAQRAIEGASNLISRVRGQKVTAPDMTVVIVGVGSVLTLAYVAGSIESYGRPTIAGDALGHYAYLRSGWIDRDLDFTNEFTDYRGPYALPDPERKTATGLVENPWPIGAAVLWAPAFAVAHHLVDPLVGEAGVRALGGRRRDGYSRPYHRAIVVASVIYGLIGLFLTYLCARNVASAGTAFLATMALFWGTPALFYVTGDPAMPHSLALFSIGLFVFLWLRWRDSTTPVAYLVLGVAAGLCTLVRFQDGVILLLPACSLLGLRHDWQTRVRLAAWLTGGLTLALLPQLWALRQIYGGWIVVPQGGSFLRFADPSVLEVLFWWHHGFVSWTPLAGVLLVTVLIFAYRHPKLGVPFLAFVAAEIYVAAAAVDWWGGAAFGARRLVSLTTPLAVTFASVLASSRPVTRGTLIAVASLLAFSNTALVESFRWGFIDDIGPVNLLTEAPQVLAARLGVIEASDVLAFSVTDRKRMLLLAAASWFCLAYRRSERAQRVSRGVSRDGV